MVWPAYRRLNNQKEVFHILGKYNFFYFQEYSHYVNFKIAQGLYNSSDVLLHLLHCL